MTGRETFEASIRRAARDVTFVLAIAVAAGCGGFRPVPVADVPFLERAVTESRTDLTVTVAVPTTAEARALFDTKLHKKNIQPVWVEVDNAGDDVAWVFPIAIDRDYFPPFEVAWKSHRTCAKSTNRRIDAYVDGLALPWEVPPRTTVAGFVFVNLDRGHKHVPLEVLRDDGLHAFDFVIPVPGLRADHASVDFVGLYGAEGLRDLAGRDEFLAWVESLPCCTGNAKGTRSGDPLNFVLVASDVALRNGFAKAGWDQTAAMTGGSMMKTAGAAVFGKSYRNAPISPLHALGRPQDIALQKARWNIHQRNHLRLWLAPVTYRGTTVWLGQISRDIGSRLTTRSPTLTTHKIDPDVDEARDYLVLDLAWADALEAFGYVPAMAPSTPSSPGKNLTGDPFWTDGRRAVLFLSETPVKYEDIRFLDLDGPGAADDPGAGQGG